MQSFRTVKLAEPPASRHDPPVAEIIDLAAVLRARARLRTQALTERCLGIMEECLASSRHAYHEAPYEERAVRASRIRQLEELIDYTANLL